MRTCAVTAIALVLVVLGGGAAGAAPVNVTVKADRSEIRGGQSFTLTAHANVPCQWLLQWNGERRVLSGKRGVTTFVAPAVTARKKLPAQATCFSTRTAPAPKKGTAPPSGPGKVAQRIVVTVPDKGAGSIGVTVVPPGSVSPPTNPHGPKPPHGPAGLPDTGGPQWWLLLAGLTLATAGSVLLRRAAR